MGCWLEMRRHWIYLKENKGTWNENVRRCGSALEECSAFFIGVAWNPALELRPAFATPTKTTSTNSLALTGADLSRLRLSGF